jgi:arylsulfatase A-like enzyme/Tfp pilus assembly protein PilF
MSKKARFILFASAAILGLLVLFFILQLGKPSFVRLRGKNDYNVILITLDTARADRIRCYGFPGIDTPTIDHFAERGIKFENCISQTPLTLPSHTTIMTGTYPLFHGVRDNGGFIVPPALTTLAEVFKMRKYQTAAFVAAYVLDSKWGLNQGFDYYFDKFDLSRFETISLSSVQRPANEVMNEALAWLDRTKASPFFSWIHLYDPHTPYEPPPPFDKKYRHPYLGEIAFADSQLGRLWDFLSKNGLQEKTFLVFTSDHGESLGAHQEATHGFFVYQEAVRVPLIVVTPFPTLWNVTSKRVVTLADIMPTVLDMLGIQPPTEIQGKSLVPLFFAPEKEPLESEYAYSETFYPRFHYGWSDLKSYQDRKYKLILAPKLELYDIVGDPMEQKNLAQDNPQVTRDLLNKATQFIEKASQKALALNLSKVDEETRQRLTALGYVGSFIDPAKLQGKTLANPKEKIGIFNELSKAREMGLKGMADEAVKTIQAIIAADPEVIDAYFTLGNIYFKERKFKDALAAFQKALEKKPDDSFTVINIANSYIGLGKAEEAEKFVLAFLQKGFQDSQFYHLLGTLKYSQKKYDESIAYFTKCLSVNSESAASHNSLGAIYLVKGDLARAEEHFRESFAINPKLHNLHFNWAQLYEKKGDLAKAAESYLKELDNSPKNFRASYNLSRIYRQMGREDNELAFLNRTRELNPNFPLTYFYLARIDLNRNQNLEEAVILVKKGIELKPEKEELPLGFFLLADLYSRLGQESLSQEYAAKGRDLAAKSR